MESLSREQIINELQGNFQSYIDKYGIDDIGIFEEEGQDDIYYIGYTIKKSGETYHLHSTFRKNNNELTPINHLWSIESDDPQGEDLTGFEDIESALHQIK